MARRRSAKQDSLELLLDTICNTFGGVLFIAILVVLLLQQTGPGTESSIPNGKVLSAVEMLDLTNRFEALTAELSRLRENHESQNEVIRSFATEDVRALLIERDRVTQSQNELQEEVDQLMLRRAELSVQVEELSRSNDEVPDQLNEAKARQKQLSAKLDEIKQSKVKELRLPVLEASTHVQVGMVMKYGRLYLWHTTDSFVRTGVNENHFVAVGNDESAATITIPHPLRGIELDESPRTRAEIRKLLEKISPQTFDLAIIVRPDSFDEFRYVRDAIVDLGFKYSLFPTGESDPIVDGGGGSGGGVQ